MKQKVYKTKDLCLRCGFSKSENIDDTYGYCSAWGVRYPRHLWNKTPQKVKVYEFAHQTTIKE